MARPIVTPPHYVRANESNRIPRRWVYLDTEAHDELVGRVRTQTWRLAVTCYDHNDNPEGVWRESDWRTHRTPAELWAYVDKKTKNRARTIVVAHNMGYDLRISTAMIELPKLGWAIEQFGLSGKTLTMTWKREKRTLVFCDSMTWWPHALAKIGEWVGITKPPLPAWDATDEAWEYRCRCDVEILQAANRHVLEWIETQDLGNWAKTGAGMAWANWRHRHYTHRVLVHADNDARAAEVAAIGTGRCEAWRWGLHAKGPYFEWDYPSAYARVATDIRVPIRLGAHVSKLTLNWLANLPTYRRAIVRATVTTSTPTLAVNDGERWYWPTGTYTGWWWDTEVELASETAESVTLHEAWTYQAAMALRSWGEWVTEVSEDQSGAYDALQRATAKHWSRALVGRFGAKYPIWTDYGAAPEPGLSIGDLFDAPTGRVGKCMTLGDRFFVGLDESYVADACPAIMGAVMAESRVRLWRAAEWAGFKHVLYMDTDGLIVDRAGDEALRLWTGEGAGWGMRRKRRYRTLDILGPRQIIPDGEARIAGVPKSARRIAGHEFVGERWEGVEQALRNGRPHAVVIRETPWSIKPTDHRRAHLPGGATEAFKVLLAAGDPGDVTAATPA